jgi:predicted TIM-barrel fold metal-dependent hydrolase
MKFFYCGIRVEPDEATVKHVIDCMGGKSIVFSTDYPHGDSEAADHFLKLPINDEAKRKILWDNCAAYYAMRSEIFGGPLRFPVKSERKRRER